MLYLVAVCSEHSTAAIIIFESGSSFCTPAKLVRGRSTASALLLEGVALRLRRLSEVSLPVVRVGCAARAAGAGSCTICGSFLPGSLTPGSPQLAHVSHKPTIGQTFQGGSCEHGPSGSRVFFYMCIFFMDPQPDSTQIYIHQLTQFRSFCDHATARFQKWTPNSRHLHGLAFIDSSSAGSNSSVPRVLARCYGRPTVGAPCAGQGVLFFHPAGRPSSGA